MNRVLASILAIGLLAAPVLATESAPKATATAPAKAPEGAKVAHAKQAKPATHKRHARVAKPAVAPAPATK